MFSRLPTADGRVCALQHAGRCVFLRPLDYDRFQAAPYAHWALAGKSHRATNERDRTDSARHRCSLAAWHGFIVSNEGCPGRIWTQHEYRAEKWLSTVPEQTESEGGDPISLCQIRKSDLSGRSSGETRTTSPMCLLSAAGFACGRIQAEDRIRCGKLRWPDPVLRGCG